MCHREDGRKGAEKVMAKYGREHYIRMAKISAQKRAERAQKGKEKVKIPRGFATLARYGVQHYVEIGRKGGKARAKNLQRLQIGEGTTQT